MSLSGVSLPVEEVLPHLLAVLDAGSNAVLVAPPGAGKTTLTPLALLRHALAWCGQKRILVVEPRRIAVRGAALRMASLLGEKPGGMVGYRTRFDKVISDRTRIEVVTEGLLVRRLLGDPLLEGVSAILFDEVHERSLDGDTGLALCLDVQRNFRPDLRLVAMSATLEANVFTERLAAPLIESAGRSWPVAVRHGRDIAQRHDLPEACVQVIRRVWKEEEGSVLVFLPGVGEIRRVQALLGNTVPVFPLYGDQPLDQQQRALDPEAGRRVVLATSIAETSVTVPGVRVVVDSGWRRKPQRDPVTGLPRLHTCRISRATAEQRAGRAGRQGPGVAVRLWSEMTQRSLIPQEVSAIREADLSDFALVTAAWQEVMGTLPEGLPLVEPPPAGALAAGRALLVLLGALDEKGCLTDAGRKMVQLGAHPRLAAMLCAARNVEEAVTAACLAAVLEERDPLAMHGRDAVPSADIRLRLALFEREDVSALSAVMAVLHRVARRYSRRVGVDVSENLILWPDCAGALLAAGFPDRVAQRTQEGRYRLAGGGSARLSTADPLAREALLVAVAFHARKGTEITLAAPLDEAALPVTLRDKLTEQRHSTLDGVSGRVVVRQRVRLGVLVLQDRTVPATLEEALPVLLEKVLSEPSRYLTWHEAARQFQARVALARMHYAPHLPDLSSDALKQDAAWLEPYVTGCDRLAQVAGLDVLAMLQAQLNYADLAELDRQLPSHVMLGGNRYGIDYTASVPSLSARAQAFYGMAHLPVLASGRVPLHAVLLSPAGRPQAVTADLERFWKNGWSDMCRDMRGRYPKHDWPEDPLQARSSGSSRR